MAIKNNRLNLRSYSPFRFRSDLIRVCSLVFVKDLGISASELRSTPTNSKRSKTKTPKKPASKTKAPDKKTKDMPKPEVRKPKAKESAKQEPKESADSGNKGKADASGKSDHPKVSEAQKRAIYNLSRRRGVSVQDLETMALDAYDCELENLNSKDASAFIRQLQQAA